MLCFIKVDMRNRHWNSVFLPISFSRFYLCLLSSPWCRFLNKFIDSYNKSLQDEREWMETEVLQVTAQPCLFFRLLMDWSAFSIFFWLYDAREELRLTCHERKVKGFKREVERVMLGPQLDAGSWASSSLLRPSILSLFFFSLTLYSSCAI